MDNALFQEYRFKYYLNANHSIYIQGRQGDLHPHTWEFVLQVAKLRQGAMDFNEFERVMSGFWQKYQNKNLNETPPFDVLNPMLETMTEYFSEQLRGLIRPLDCELMRIEGSESPTRSFCISYDQSGEYIRRINGLSRQALSHVFDCLLDSAGS